MGINTTLKQTLHQLIIYTNITNTDSLNRVKSNLNCEVLFLYQEQDNEETDFTRRTNLRNLFSSNITLFDSSKFDGFTGYDLANAQREKAYICDVMLDRETKLNKLHYYGKMYLQSCTSSSFDTLDAFIMHINDMLNAGKAFPAVLPINEIDDKIDFINSVDMGYGKQYQKCPMLWGEVPAQLVVKASEAVKKQFPVKDAEEIQCIDLGCGNGKNSIFLASQGFSVLGVDADQNAIKRAISDCKYQNARWETGNILNLNLGKNKFHIAVMTGSLHCLETKQQIEDMVKKAQDATVQGGLNIFSAFNSTDLTAFDSQIDNRPHQDGFTPTALGHDEWVSLYPQSEWEFICEPTNKKLFDKHPDTNIEHTHTITRFLAKKM